jgi:hypothetical protein
VSVLGFVAPATAARASIGASSEQSALRLGLKQAAAQYVGARASADAAAPHSSTTTAVGDPASDNGPDFDSRGDVRAMAIADNGTAIAVGIGTTAFDEPTTSANWQGAALGDPAFTVGTGILWLLDVNNDKIVDYDVFFVGNGTGVTAVVTRDSDVDTVLCTAVPSWGADKGYDAGFLASCIGRPAHVRASVFMAYQTPTTLSEDTTAATAPATPSPILTHKTANCTIRAMGNNKLVTAETTRSGVHKGELRARSTGLSTSDEFRCVAVGTNQWAIQSRANGKYVTAEVGDPGSRKGVLRARAGKPGSREKYNFRAIDGCSCYALRAVNGKFVTTEANLGGSSRGLLRAKAPSVGKWQKFVITTS